MSEKEKDREEGVEQPQEEGEICVDVTIHGTYIGVIRLKRGAALEDLIEELQRRGHLDDLSKFFAVMIDGKTIYINTETGKASENPLLSENCVISLLKKILGGDLLT